MCTEQTAQHLAANSPSAPPSRGALVSRRTAILAGAGATASTAMSFSGVLPAVADRRDHRTSRGRVDLTHTLAEGFPAFAPGEEAIRRPATTIPSDGYYMQRWEIYEHTGTHVDAPAHFNPNGRYVNELTPAELMLPAVVIDIARRAARNPDAVVTVDDLSAHERRHGRIEDRAAVLMYSGWASKVTDADAYRGTDDAGGLHFPGFSADACEWLIRRRRICALGVDTLSIDPGVSETFDTHTILNGAERYGIENLANLDKLPPRGAEIVVGVVPFELGSGGPAKVLATWR